MKRLSSALFLTLIACATTLPWLAQAADDAAVQEKIQLADNAPDSYTVTKGDTLWGISGKFLKSPWRWPEVWKLNTEQIKNPHWIYPGQVIYLDRNNPNGPTLSLLPPSENGKVGYERLSPQVYATPLAAPITSVPLQHVQQFLAEPLILESENPPDSGTVIAIQDNRVVAAAGETVFARNLPSGTDSWNIYRPGKPIRDPRNEKNILGYEAIMVATARTTIGEQGNQAAAVEIVNSKHEATLGDRLLPRGKETNFAYVPHAAPASIDARVASIYGGVNETGPMGLVTISSGRDQGLEPGHIVALSRFRGNAIYRGPEGGDKAQEIPLPDARYGLGFVFRVFNHMSYVLVLESTQAVHVGDKAISPN